MADNYLEKQYDDYLARKAEWERRKRGAGTKKPALRPRREEE